MEDKLDRIVECQTTQGHMGEAEIKTNICSRELVNNHTCRSGENKNRKDSLQHVCCPDEEQVLSIQLDFGQDLSLMKANNIILFGG